MGFTDRAIANTSSSDRHEQGGQLSSGLPAVEGDGGLFALPPTITQPVTFATRICSRAGGGGTLTAQKARRQFDHDGTEKYKVQRRFHVGIWMVYWGCRQQFTTPVN